MNARILRQHATTIALVVLALAAAVTVLVVDRGAVTTTEAEQRKKNLFESFRIDEISEFSVTVEGKTARLLRGAADDAGQRPWEVEIAGARMPADVQVVDQYLGALDMGTAERRVPAASVDRPRFGLDLPRILVKVSMGSRAISLAVGGPAPAPEGSAYAEIDGRDVAVITRELAATLDVRPEGFRARAFVPYAPDQIQAISLDGEGGARRIVRAHAGGDRGAGFRFDGGAPEGSVRVSAAGLEKIWQAIHDLDADAFLADADADHALEKKISVTLTPRDGAGKRAIVDLGGACPGHPDDIVAIQREPMRTSACVSQAALDGLRTPAADLVDRRALAAPADEVTEVKMSGEGRTVEIARQGPQWHERVPTDRSLDGETGRAFLDALLEVEGDKVVPASALKGADRAPVRATVRLISVMPAGAADAGDEERVETIEVGAERDGIVQVHRLEDDAIVMVPKDRAAALLPSDAALRPRQLFDEPVQSFRAIKIEGGGHVQRLVRVAPDKFKLVEPKGEGLTADDGLTSDVLQALSALTVDRWVDEKEASPASLGLEAPRISIEAEVSDTNDGPPAKTLRVALGAPAGAGGGSFAREGGGAIFVAPKALEAAATRWLVDRGATQIDPAAIRRVVLAAEGGKKVVIEQADGVFRIAGAPADPASTAKAAAIRDALADLAAEGAVSIGKPEKAQGLDRPRITITAEPEGVSGKAIKIAIGSGDAYRGTSVVYARREGVDATFAIAQAKVRPLLDALGIKQE